MVARRHVEQAHYIEGARLSASRKLVTFDLFTGDWVFHLELPLEFFVPVINSHVESQLKTEILAAVLTNSDELVRARISLLHQFENALVACVAQIKIKDLSIEQLLLGINEGSNFRHIKRCWGSNVRVLTDLWRTLTLIRRIDFIRTFISILLLLIPWF